MKLQNILLSATLATLILLGGIATATESEMEKLPSFSVFACMICHISPTPTGGDFNAFGTDFNTNGRLWNDVLALLDSDEDGCSNGSELGDVDGGGVLDEGILEESSNPGDNGDCSSASTLDEVTWGQLKAMFDSR